MKKLLSRALADPDVCHLLGSLSACVVSTVATIGSTATALHYGINSTWAGAAILGAVITTACAVLVCQDLRHI